MYLQKQPLENYYITYTILADGVSAPALKLHALLRPKNFKSRHLKMRKYLTISYVGPEFYYVNWKDLQKTIYLLVDCATIFGIKPNYFKKQYSSSSFLLNIGNNTGQTWQWSTQHGSFMS